MIAGPEHAHWEGHFHTRTTGVMGMVDYAIIANDYVAKQFAISMNTPEISGSAALGFSRRF